MTNLVNSKQFLILTLEIMARAPAGILPYVARNYARTRRRWLRKYRASSPVDTRHRWLHKYKDEEEEGINTGLRAAVRDELADKLEAETPRYTFSPASVKTYAPRRTDRGAKYR
jgi:hypothetical protein